MNGDRGGLLSAGGVLSITAGAICMAPSVIFGIPALIFVSLEREEFEAGY